MSKLSEIRGADAIDFLADIMEPLADILEDEEIQKSLNCDSRIRVVQKMVKLHKEDVIRILAMLSQEDPEAYSPSVLEIISGLKELIEDPEISPFFTLRGQKEDGSASGSATENTGEKEK